MSYVPFVARPASVRYHALCPQLWILIEIFPSIIFRLVSLFRFPRVLLASVVFRVRLERRNLVEVFVSVVTHELFLCCC